MGSGENPLRTIASMIGFVNSRRPARRFMAIYQIEAALT
jgi:hypothetical protein